MSEFRWNSGGSLHSKDWEEHLPTDSAVCIILQLSTCLVWVCEGACSLNTCCSQLHS
jgi:hypothetical protein